MVEHARVPGVRSGQISSNAQEPHQAPGQVPSPIVGDARLNARSARAVRAGPSPGPGLGHPESFPVSMIPDWRQTEVFVGRVAARNVWSALHEATAQSHALALP